MRTWSFGIYSVTSSSVVASCPFMTRVSRNRVPTPDFTSDRNSTFIMCGTACENRLMSATVLKTKSIGAFMVRVTTTRVILPPAGEAVNYAGFIVRCKRNSACGKGTSNRAAWGESLELFFSYSQVELKLSPLRAPVSQLDRANPSGRLGRAFEPLRARHSFVFALWKIMSKGFLYVG